MIEDSKAAAEGALSEIKICLGLTLNTKSLTVHLPHHKYLAWDSDIKNHISRKTISREDLKSIIGKLKMLLLSSKLWVTS